MPPNTPNTSNKQGRKPKNIKGKKIEQAVDEVVLNRYNKSSKIAVGLSKTERRAKNIRHALLFCISAPVVLGSIQALIPVDEIIMQNKVAGADSDKLVKGFSAHSVELSKKYPGKAAWILTKNGQHIDQGTTKYIPIEGAYHAGFTHLNCDSESYITYYTRRIVSLWSSTEHNFNCQLGEEPNNIPG